MAKQICNLEEVPATGFNIKFSIHFGLVWNEMQSSLPTETDACRNHDVNENYKLLLIIPRRIENVA